MYGISNNDTFGHLALGRQIAALGHVPELDTWSFWRATPQRFVNFEWLGDILMWWAYAAGGYDALIAFKLLLLALLAMLLVRLAAERGGLPVANLTTLLIVLSLPAVRYRFTERPQVFGLLLSAWLMFALRRIADERSDQHATRRVWLWIAVVGVSHLIWVNLHGSNLFGLVLTAIQVVSYWNVALARRRLLGTLALQIVASCVSPYGPAILTDAILLVSDGRYRQLISEWAPWQAGDPPLWAAALAVQTALLLMCVKPLRAAGRQATAALISLVLLGAMTVRSLRFIDYYLLLGAPWIAEGLVLRLPQLSAARSMRWIYASWPLACLFALWTARQLPPFQPLGWGLWPANLPLASGEWIQKHRPHARIFTNMPEDFYLMFAAPEARFFHDGRVSFYGPEHAQLATRALGAPKIFRSIVKRFGIDTVLIHHSLAGERAVFLDLRAGPDFVLVAIEDRHALYVRPVAGAQVLDPASIYRVLVPGYEPQQVLGTSSALPDIQRELACIPRVASTQSYRGFLQALLALRPFARSAHTAGFRAPRTAGERATFASAFELLAGAADRVADVPLLYAYAAAAGIGACRLDEAAHYLRLAAESGASRETLLLEQELALQRGESAEVAHFIERARTLPNAEHDPWLLGLSEAVHAGLRCPD
jgi:hypothetical protein